MRIVIDIIDHKEQRYSTCGDWQITPEGLLITVSKLGDFYQKMCVGVHELVESILCLKRGVSQYDVDQFDTQFEANRLPNDTSEPGDNIDAPYKNEHFVATNIERILARELGIDWSSYENTINNLPSLVDTASNDSGSD